MASDRGGGSLLVALELLERGDPAFVDELRQVVDADALGAFAKRWFVDRRPAARRFLLDYLDRPLNAYRQEALVKRLFKLAEQAGDDEVMARFLVLFDRSVRRVRSRRRHRESQEVNDREQAIALVSWWRDQGFDQANMYETWQKRFQVWELVGARRQVAE